MRPEDHLPLKPAQYLTLLLLIVFINRKKVFEIIRMLLKKTVDSTKTASPIWVKMLIVLFTMSALFFMEQSMLDLLGR